VPQLTRPSKSCLEDLISRKMHDQNKSSSSPPRRMGQEAVHLFVGQLIRRHTSSSCSNWHSDMSIGLSGTLITESSQKPCIGNSVGQKTLQESHTRSVASTTFIPRFGALIRLSTRLLRDECFAKAATESRHSMYIHGEHWVVIGSKRSCDCNTSENSGVLIVTLESRAELRLSQWRS